MNKTEFYSVRVSEFKDLCIHPLGIHDADKDTSDFEGYDGSVVLTKEELNKWIRHIQLAIGGGQLQ